MGGRGDTVQRGPSICPRALVHLILTAGDIHGTATGGVATRVVRRGAALLHAAEASAAGEEASETDGAVCIDEGRGEVLLARVDVQWRVEEGEEAGTGGHGGFICGGVWEEAGERGEGELREATSKGKVLVSQRGEASRVRV